MCYKSKPFHFWIALVLLFGGSNFLAAQSSLALGMTNVRTTTYSAPHLLANFVGLNIDYQLRFKPKLPCAFVAVTIAHFPAVDNEMDKRLFVHDPFGRFPMLQLGGILLGARQDLRQKRNVQPYLELGGGAYLRIQRSQDTQIIPNPLPPVKGVLLGGVAGSGVRFIGKRGITLGIQTRLHFVTAFTFPPLFSYFEWGGFLSYTFPSKK